MIAKDTYINIFLLTLLVYIVPLCSFAYVPELVEPTSVSDVYLVESPEQEKMFFGDMASFPHTYEINSIKPFNLYVEIRMPDIESSENNMAGIIIRQKGRGGVDEVVRMNPNDAEWSVVRESFENEEYRVGPIFDSELDGGIYRVEVSTPDNVEKYVLIMGKEDSNSDIDYFGKVSAIADVKEFFDKSKLTALWTRTVLVPGLLLVGFFGLLLYLYKKRRKSL